MRANDTPAFPILPPLDAAGQVPPGYPFPADGMTLRDCFALKAMRIAFDERTNHCFTDAMLAERAYRIADAMLAERAKP